jgi:hypothetical protein
MLLLLRLLLLLLLGVCLHPLLAHLLAHTPGAQLRQQTAALQQQGG